MSVLTFKGIGPLVREKEGMEMGWCEKKMNGVWTLKRDWALKIQKQAIKWKYIKLN